MTPSGALAGWWTVLAVGMISADAAESTRPMSLKECVIIALQQAFDLQIGALDQEIAANEVRAANGAYDPALTATVQVSDATAPGGFDTRTGEFVDSQTETKRASVGVSGLLPTGGTYTVGASATDSEGTSGSFPFSHASAYGPFVELRQPLLENFSIDDARLNIRVSEQNLHISALDLRQSMHATINRVEEAYYDLVAARENVKVQESALKLAEELWRDNQKRVALGVMAPIDAAEARSQAATSRATLLSTKRFLRAAGNALKGAMVDDYAQWRELSILPSSELSRKSTSLAFNQSWALAQKGRPDLLTLQIQVEQRHLILRRRGNELLPQLDLTASAGLTGSARKLSVVRDQIRNRDAPFYSLGLSLALPLTHRREREAHRTAAAQAEQARLRLQQFRQSMMIQIDDAISQAQTNFERLAATREAREFAERALTNEQGMLAQGNSTNFVVLQLQRNLTAARSEEIQSLIDYNKSLARLRFLEGESPIAYQIDLTPTNQTSHHAPPQETP